MRIQSYTCIGLLGPASLSSENLLPKTHLIAMSHRLPVLFVFRPSSTSNPKPSLPHMRPIFRYDPRWLVVALSSHSVARNGKIPLPFNSTSFPSISSRVHAFAGAANAADSSGDDEEPASLSASE